MISNFLTKKDKNTFRFFLFLWPPCQENKQKLVVIFLFNIVRTHNAAKTLIIGKKLCLLQNISLAQLYFLLFVIL